jgi:RHS repeat-associated protein
MRPEQLRPTRRVALGLAALALGGAASWASADTITRTITYTYYTGVSSSDPNYQLGHGGLLKSVTREPANPSLCSTTTFSYDTYRNLTSAQKANCASASGLAVFQTSQGAATYPAVSSQSLSGTSTPVNVAAGVFPASLSVSDGVSNTSNILSQSLTYDPRYGVELSAKAPDGTVSSQVVDGFGRVTRQTLADSTSVVTLYCVLSSSGLDTSSNSAGCAGLSFDTNDGEVPADAVQLVQREPHNSADAKMGAFERTYLDRQGRAIRVVTQSFDGGAQPASAGTLVAKDTVYNAEGVVVTVTQPYFLSNKSSLTSGSSDFGGTRVDYDPLGRPSAVYVADSDGSQSSVSIQGIGTRRAAVTSYSYSGLKTTVTNDKGYKRVEERNALGRLVRITDDSGAQAARQYDAFGDLVTAMDALQNVVKMTYDSWGHQLSLVDPDLGTIGYCYDAADQLRAQQDSKMRGSATVGPCPTGVGGVSTTATPLPTWVTFAYDYAGRMTQRAEPDTIATWSYDGCSNGKGKLCEASTKNGMDRTYVYDLDGRISSSKTVITNGPVWAMAVDYDNLTGRVAHQTWPTGLQAQYGYTTQGYLNSLSLVTSGNVSGTTIPATLWTQGKRDAWGQSESESLGNGTTAQASFDPFRGSPLARWAGTATYPKIALDQTYTWDSLGRMSYRADNNGDGSNGAVSESFGYDDINRLTSYAVSGPGVSNLSRTVSLQYNAIGSLLYKSDVGDYIYPASGSAMPHAVKSVNGVAYTYDNGNLVNAASGKYSSLSYSSFNQPISASSSTASYTWQYDDAHQRLVESHTTGQGTRTTWYAHPDGEGDLGFEYVKETDGTYSSRHYLTAGDETIVLISGGTLPSLGSANSPSVLSSINLNKVEYWQSDAIGSVASTADQNSTVTARYAYDPFGKRRYSNGNYDQYGNLVIDWVDTAPPGTGRGFTSHEQLDDIGIVNMNGRVYDPQIGRFMQADGFVPHPEDLQSFNRYSYCRNSPISCIDPSGYLDGIDDGGLASEATSSYWDPALNIPPNAGLVCDVVAGCFAQWSNSDTDFLISLGTKRNSLINSVQPSMPVSWAAAINLSVGTRTNALSTSGSGGTITVGGSAAGGPSALGTGDSVKGFQPTGFQQLISAEKTFGGPIGYAAGAQVEQLSRLLGTMGITTNQGLPYDYAANQVGCTSGTCKQDAVFSLALFGLGVIGPEFQEANSVARSASADGKFYSVAFEMRLDPKSYPGVTRYMHFKEANVALESAMSADAGLAANMEALGVRIPRSESGSIIGKPPADWVWHHDQSPGVMQLVPKSQHPNIPGGIFWDTLHPDGKGGFSIWGKKD